MRVVRRALAALGAVGLVAGGLSACTPPPTPDAPTGLVVQVEGAQPHVSPAALDEAAVTELTELGEVTAFIVGTPMQIELDGDMPDSGAELSRRYAAPLPDDAAATFAYWNEDFQSWVAVPTTVSDDRRTITASVTHFSIWTDFVAGGKAAVESVQDAAAKAGQAVAEAGKAVSDWVGDAVDTTGKALETASEALHWSLGNIFTTRVELPECDMSTPTWVLDLPVGTGVDDPVRFCAGHDASNPDLLVVKARANRGYGFPVALAVKPTWEDNSTYDSDLASAIDTVGSVDAVVGESMAELLNEGRFVGAGDEISFGIAPDALRDYSAEFLLELPAPSLGQFIASTIAQQVTAWGASHAEGLLAASIATASCWSAVSGNSDVGTGAGAVLTCLSGADEKIAQLLGRVFLARGMQENAAGKLAGKLVGRASVALALLPAVISSFDFSQEIRLPRNARALTISVDENALDVVPGFPAELQGRWCTRPDAAEQECFSLSDMLAKHPALALYDASSESRAPGTTTYALCLDLDLGDSCTMAATALYRYFPAGVAWDCASMSGFGMDCDPDYSGRHDTSLPRLVGLYNHQQDVVYHDSPPMYRQ